ncbi:hypothetical protein BDM02DRAFT_3112057 [Thelephora ganbajun]|uniref:Uncharacterized protein n=1 Tax=Thelephora ganbajun TaxID=370292 RepID=A0ACB6ZM79_THEGA|nr:hypothetical protein BDM02DRAFT_3112057 [Thelephora ganbajun]
MVISVFNATEGHLIDASGSQSVLGSSCDPLGIPSAASPPSVDRPLLSLTKRQGLLGL